jgi:solute carrier family 10 (sodium/bile acid cotransporter), member 7
MITETMENVIPNEREPRHIPPIMRQTLSRFAPDTFTLLLVGTVLLASFAPPTAALETPVKIATDVAIAFMFFLYGARLATANVIAGVAHWRLHALVLASTFVMFPAIGLLLFHGLPQWLAPGPLALGMLYLCLLPSTIQSSLAFTSIAGGNVPAAMCSATLSSLIGAVATPLLVAMFASARGSAPTGDAIREIGLLLIAPLVAGQCLRPWIGGFVLRHKAILSATDRGSILLVVYGAFGHAVSAGLWRALPISGFAVMVAIEAFVLGAMLVGTYLAAKAFGFNREDTIAIVFCGSKKSLAAGVPMAGVLFPGPDLGMILLPTMLFHQMQLMVCAVLARRWASQAAAEAQAPAHAVAPPLGVAAPAR